VKALDAPRGATLWTRVPPRLDALFWSPWHRRVVLALGITWVLDGLEASFIANLAPTLEDPRTLGLTAGMIGVASSVYLCGQVLGALLFGHLADRHGRKRLFFITLSLYLVATALSGAAPSYAVFLVTRFCAGAGIGGEYSAINSTIDELVPARVRGQVDLTINGSYWLGVAAGAALTVLLLDPRIVPIRVGWRLCFLLGAALGLIILRMRKHIPESPRWLLMHGYEREANRVMRDIEIRAGQQGQASPPAIAVEVTGALGFLDVLTVLFAKNRKRAVLGMTLMVAQAFFYNAIFFSYGLVLERFHGVPASRVGLYIVPFAIGNFAGPLGRRVMIPLTNAAAGILLAVSSVLLFGGQIGALGQTLWWCGAFFFASAAASAAYLTVSELFPTELRGLAIALFYSFATAIGAIAPTLFGRIIESGSTRELLFGNCLAASMMIGAAVVARILGVASEGRSLEALRA
jgi:MFS family permease